MNSHELYLAQKFIQSHVVAAARDLEQQPLSSVQELLQALPVTQAHRVLVNMLPTYVARLCEHIPLELAAQLLADGDTNHLVSILRCMPRKQRGKLLPLLPEKTATFCKLLLNYSEDTVGAWMIADIIMLPTNITVRSALERLADPHSMSDSDALPVVDEKIQVIGLVSVRTLLSAHPDAIINELVDDRRPVISSRASLTSITHHEGWQRYDTLAVLNRHRQLVGLLRHVDLRRGLEHFITDIKPVSNEGMVASVGQMYFTTIAAIFDLFSASSSVNVEEQR